MNYPPERRGPRHDDADTAILPSFDDAPTEQMRAVGQPPAPPRAARYADDEPVRPLYRDEPPLRRVAPERPGGGDEPPKPGRGKKIFLWVISSLVALTLVAIAVFYFMVRDGLSKVERVDLMPQTTKAPAPVTGPMNFLILGLDGRDPNEPDRTDTMILAHIPNDHKKVYLVSLPRDSWVQLPNDTWGKINAANQLEGPPGAVKVVESTLKTHIDHVVTMNFDGFVMMTESLGGVTVDNPIESYQQLGNYHFPKGKITVSGKQALAFVRQRKELPNGDLDRTARQRLVIRAIMDQLLSAGTLTNPVKMNQLVQQMAKTIKLDKGMTDDRIQSIATSMQLKSGKDIESIIATTAGYGTTSMGESIVILDEEDLADLQTALKNDTLDKYVAKHKNDPPVSGNMPVGGIREGKVVKPKR